MTDNNNERLIRPGEREQLTGISQRSWDDMERQGLVPKRVKFNGYNNAWLHSELMHWIAELREQRDKTA